jgi:hypothetical protein
VRRQAREHRWALGEQMGAFFKYGLRTRRAFAVISTTNCFAMTTDLLDHVQAVRSAYEAAILS